VRQPARAQPAGDQPLGGTVGVCVLCGARTDDGKHPGGVEVRGGICSHRRRLSGEPILTVIEESGSRLVITESGLVSAELETRLSTLLPEVRLVKLDQLAHEPDGSNLDVRIEPGDLALCNLHLGFDGEAERAMVEHAGMMNHLLARSAMFEITRDSVKRAERIALFDISVWQFFAGPAWAERP